MQDLRAKMDSAEVMKEYISRDLICINCKKLVLDPRATECSCEGFICNECTHDFKGNILPCPRCGKSAGYRDLNRMELDKISHVKCYCTREECPSKGERILFTEFVKHKCEPKRIECPNLCGDVIDAANLRHHAENCKNLKLDCATCRETLKNKDNLYYNALDRLIEQHLELKNEVRDQ